MVQGAVPTAVPGARPMAPMVAWCIRGPAGTRCWCCRKERVNARAAPGVRQAVVGVGLLVLLPAPVVAALARAPLAGPALRRLTQAVDELAQGRSRHPSGWPRADELGRLANAFDTMAADLSQQRRWQMTHAQAPQTEVDERRQVMQRLQQERARPAGAAGRHAPGHPVRGYMGPACELL